MRKISKRKPETNPIFPPKINNIVPAPYCTPVEFRTSLHTYRKYVDAYVHTHVTRRKDDHYYVLPVQWSCGVTWCHNSVKKMTNNKKYDVKIFMQHSAMQYDVLCHIDDPYLLLLYKTIEIL